MICENMGNQNYMVIEIFYGPPKAKNFQKPEKIDNFEKKKPKIIQKPEKFPSIPQLWTIFLWKKNYMVIETHMVAEYKNSELYGNCDIFGWFWQNSRLPYISITIVVHFWTIL